MYNFLLWKESKIFIRLKKDKNLIYDKKNNKQISNLLTKIFSRWKKKL